MYIHLYSYIYRERDVCGCINECINKQNTKHTNSKLFNMYNDNNNNDNNDNDNSKRIASRLIIILIG